MNLKYYLAVALTVSPRLREPGLLEPHASPVSLLVQLCIIFHPAPSTLPELLVVY